MYDIIQNEMGIIDGRVFVTTSERHAAVDRH